MASESALDLCLVAEEAVSDEQDAMIRDCLVECFPDDRQIFRRTRNWHTEPIYRVLGLDGEGVVQGHIAVVEQTITVGGESLAVAGVQSVAVRLGYRGRRIADDLLKAAMAEAKRRDLDVGLLFCREELMKVYERCGWLWLGPRLTLMLDEHGSEVEIPEKNVVMYYPLGVVEFPTGDINLCGRDW
ncbi:MAG: GNAT family N-acetyltransferase [Sedimentisphaerales bacterium]|nr:GNAT family N-acetyltransferase [Sedimentisphaerales bacterium]